MNKIKFNECCRYDSTMAIQVVGSCVYNGRGQIRERSFGTIVYGSRKRERQRRTWIEDIRLAGKKGGI